MGILGNSNSLAADIDKATSETNTQEKWGLIMDVCDKVTNGAVNSKECLKVIVKRLNHSDPHVVMQAITLLDACVSNCGKQFHLEVASREFETEFRKLLQKSQPKVNTRLKLCLKKWAESEFKSDPQLNLIPSLYMKLRADGHEFSDPSVTPKREVVLSKDPNVVSSQQEEEDIAKAIELSLKETKSSAGASGSSSSQSPKMASSGGGAAASSSLYPSLMSTTATSTAPAAEPRKVRALYDFEAAEDNEMTFHAGEVLMVLDDSDPNWWKGENHRGEGLFPSNFVTTDLNAEPEGAASKTKKNVQFSDEQKKDEEEDEEEKAKEQVVEINEEKIDRLLHLLHEADPEDPSADSEEMLQLEQMVNQMGPLIDTELERVDRKHAQLTQLSSDLVEAINLYHTLMREPDRSMMMGSSGYGMGGFPGQAPMPGMYSMPGMYGPNMPGMFPGMGGMPGGMPPYGMGQLRHDMGQMSVSSIPQFPPPQQSMPTMSQNGPSSLPPHQNPTGGALGQPPMHHPHMPSQPGTQQPQPTQPQHMPNMTIQQQPTTSAAPHMMNMGHMQSPLPQNFSNPISPPPVISSAPTSLPQHQHQQQQQQPPAVLNQPIPRPPMQQQQPPQPVGAPAGSFPAYGSVPPPPQQQQHHQAPQNGPVPPPPPTATAPPPNNMNHHHHPHPPQMAPALPPYQTTALPSYMHQMPPGGGAPAGFPHHHMLGHMMAPPPGSPLSINTASNSPQNIPIYQQQR